MTESDSPSSAETDSAIGSKNTSTPSSSKDSTETGNPNLSPLEGGRWRPVAPDELLKKPSSHPDPDEEPAKNHAEVRLERRQQLEHKLKANPTDLDGFLELAAIYRGEERPLEAKRLLKQAAQIFPDNEEVRFQYEEALLARSLQQLREVTDLANRVNSAETDRELVRSRHDWACRRIDVCHARLQREPQQLSLRLALAEAKFDAELFEDAFTEAGNLLQNDDLAPQAHFIRARCYLALGKDLIAMKELRSVAMRRAVVAPIKLRINSLKLLCEIAEKLVLEESGRHYRQLLEQLELAQKEGSSK